MMRFQSTPFREGRRVISMWKAHNVRFNPRPFARGDKYQVTVTVGWYVSIHALSRGATIRNPRHRLRPGVSIHALSRGATRHIALGCAAPFQFQSTPFREGRRKRQRRVHAVGTVSIHALSRGATGSALNVKVQFSFQSTPFREGRRCNPDGSFIVPLFQSTPFREGRPANNFVYPARDIRFNPRPFARGDSKWFLISFGNSGIHPLFCYIRRDLRMRSSRILRRRFSKCGAKVSGILWLLQVRTFGMAALEAFALGRVLLRMTAFMVVRKNTFFP